MIAQLKGIVVHKQAPWLLLDVNGVGYEVEAPMTTFYDLPEVGQSVHLHTHFVVREDAQLLYGFSRLNERDLFRLLLKVNGIGPRVALAILSTLSSEEFIHAIHFNDSVKLTSVPGIGKKTAERVLIEMRDKVDKFDNQANKPDNVAGFDNSSRQNPSIESDALSALESLGYKSSDALKVIRAVLKSELENIKTSEDLIRYSLKALSK